MSGIRLPVEGGGTNRGVKVQSPRRDPSEGSFREDNDCFLGFSDTAFHSGTNQRQCPFPSEDRFLPRTNQRRFEQWKQRPLLCHVLINIVGVRGSQEVMPCVLHSLDVTHASVLMVAQDCTYTEMTHAGLRGWYGGGNSFSTR